MRLFVGSNEQMNKAQTVCTHDTILLFCPSCFVETITGCPSFPSSSYRAIATTSIFYFLVTIVHINDVKIQTTNSRCIAWYPLDLMGHNAHCVGLSLIMIDFESCWLPLSWIEMFVPTAIMMMIMNDDNDDNPKWSKL